MNLSSHKIHSGSELGLMEKNSLKPFSPTGTFEGLLPWQYIQRTLQMAGIGYWRITIEAGRMSFNANGSFIAMAGLAKENFPPIFEDFINTCIHPDDREKTVEIVLMRNGNQRRTYDFEARLLNHLNGQWKWVHCFGEVGELDLRGRPKVIFGCIIDTNQTHEARLKLVKKEADLRQEWQRIDAIIDAAGLIIWDWDLTTETVRYGDSVYISKGMGEARPIHEPWSESMSPEDQAKVLEARRRYLQGETSHYEAEIQVRRPTGELFWAHDKGRVVERDKSGRPTRMMGATIDISERRATDLALAESRRRLEQLVEAANIAVWDWDIHQNKLSVNNNYSQILGYDKEELESLGEKWFEYVHPDDREMVRSAITGLKSGHNDSLHLDHRLISKNGKFVWVYSLIKAVGRDKNGRPSHIIGAQVDFSDKKRLEERQTQAMALINMQKSELEKQLRQRTDVLGDIQKQMERLLLNTGLRLDPTQKDLKIKMDELLSRIPATGFDSGGDSVKYIRLAFQYIGNEMVWYKAVLDNLPIPISIFDLEKQWTYLNHPVMATIGVKSVEEMIGQDYHKGWKNFHDHQVVFQNGPGCRKTFIRQFPKLGKYFFCHASVLNDRNGRTIGFIETMQDITGTYEADSRMRLMMDATPMASVVFDENGAVVECNLEAVSLSGMSSKDDYLKHFFDLIPPTMPDGRATATVLLCSVNQAFRNGRAYLETLYLHDANGRLLTGEVFMTRVSWGDGYIVLACFRDLGEIVAARKKIDRERLLLKDILEGCPIAFAMSVDDKVLLTNPFTRETLGLSEGDRLSRIVMDPGDESKMKNTLRLNLPVNWQPVKIRDAKGRAIETLVNAYSTDYENQRFHLSWIMDVTELKRKGRELEIARDLAEASAKAKSDFLANISHEIRTPMNAIIGLNHLLLQTDLSEQQREYASKGDTASRALLHLINDILDFSKIEAGKLELSVVEFSLTDLLTQTVDLFAPQAFSKGLEFILNVDPNLPMFLKGDDFRILQIINNLISNAIKFTAKGEIRLAVSPLTASEGENRLLFTVTDTGIGLNQSQAEKLFSAFTQADSSHTRRYGGSGLGLAISKQLVNLMGGEIWCRSQPDRGSTFGFTIRLSPSGRSDRFLTLYPPFKGLDILLVDDNLNSRQSIEASLSTLGCTVLAAGSGDEALEIMSGRRKAGLKTDLLLIDQDMPDKNGRETLQDLRKLTGGEVFPAAALMVGAGLTGGEDQDKNGPTETVIKKPFLAPDIAGLIGPILELDEKGYNSPKRPLPKASDPAELVSQLAGAKILLAEDNEVNQLVARKILQKAGFAVTVAENGKIAVDMVKHGSEKFDLVLMDIQMPVMDGLAAAVEIRRDQRFKALPIVAMTAHAMDQDREKSLEVGMNDHLTKPLDIAAMFKCLARWIKPSS